MSSTVSNRRERRATTPKRSMSDVENQEELNLKIATVAASGSDGAAPKAHPPAAPTNGLFLLIVAWYASSVVCTNTSKSLKLPWTTLTFFQMLISTLCAVTGILVFKLDGQGSLKLWPKPEARKLTVLLSLAFCAGFVLLNASLSFMHVSAVMTLRAAEPVATWLLGLMLLPDEKSSLSAILALIPVVIGAGLSAVAKGTNVNLTGLGLVTLCNVCFALRTITTKRLKQQFSDIDDFNLFLQLCLMGSIWQGIVVLAVGRDELAHLVNIPVLLLNGLTFYLYLQLSWVVMSKVGAVTHSVCNSLRRPVICATGWIIFGGASMEGIAGVLIATGGTMLYAKAKRRG